jgi:hypothetical protein
MTTLGEVIEAWVCIALGVVSQATFYPVLSEDYAVKIARDWNVPASGKGYVTRCLIAKTFLDQVQEAGFLRRSARCTRCGGKCADLQHPSARSSDIRLAFHARPEIGARTRHGWSGKFCGSGAHLRGIGREVFSTNPIAGPRL